MTNTSIDKQISAQALVLNDWKEAMLDECVITHTAFYADDPRKTLLSLIHWHIKIALDPTVSQSARQAKEHPDTKDAERYRYLRADEEGIEFRDRRTGTWRSDCPSGSALDSIIDAAIQSAKEQTP